MFKRKNIFFAAFFVSALLSFGFFQTAEAIEYGMLGGKPANPDPGITNSGSWFIYNLNPGEIKDDGILVMNLFDSPNEILVYAADTTPSSSGGFALKQFSEDKKEVGAWVKFYPDSPPQFFQEILTKKENKISAICRLSREEMQKEFGKKPIISDAQFQELGNWCLGKDSVQIPLAAKEKKIIPFVISIPATVDVGEHTGGILVQKVTPEDTTSNGSSVKLTTRVGVRIYETVPGEIVRKLSLENFKIIKNFSEFNFSDWLGEKRPKEYLIQTSIVNNGNVSVEHNNNIVIKNILSGKEEMRERKFQALKGDKFVANLSWEKPLAGYYSFRPEIKYQGSGGEETLALAPIGLLVIPWREMSIVAFILILAGLGYWLWRRNWRKKYGGIGWEEYKVKKTDTVAKLAEKYKIGWKVLVKTNKLKAPYLLEAGQTILAPPAGSKEEIESDNFQDEAKNKLKAGDAAETQEAGEKTEKERKADAAEKEDAPKKKTSGRSGKNMDVIAKLARREKKEEVMITVGNWHKKKIIWVVAAIVVIILTVAVVLLMSNKRKDREISQKLSITPVGAPAAEKVEEKTKLTIEKAAEKVDIAELKIKVLNEGAAAGLAGKAKTALVSQGYAKAEAGNGEADNVAGNFVYYSADKFKAEAGRIGEFLATRKIKAKVAAAETEEQKSAEIIVILGK